MQRKNLYESSFNLLTFNIFKVTKKKKLNGKKEVNFHRYIDRKFMLFKC